MLEADSWHGWIVPRVQDRPRLQKPPLIYWLEAASASVCTGRILGREYSGNDAVWMYRLPSLLAAIGTALVTLRLGRRIFAPPAALLGAVLLSCSPVMFWEARQGRADMVMLFFTTLALHGMWHVLEAARWSRPAQWKWILIMWGAVSLGVLTKGPVPLMVVSLAALVLAALGGGWPLIARFRPLVGLALVLTPIGAWVLLLSREIDLAEYLRGVWRETGGRAGSAMEGHWGPAGYHTALVFVAMFPACLMLGPSIVRAVRTGLATTGTGWNRIRNLRWSHRPRAFLLAAIVPSWIVFEFTGTKLPHYTLPLYPLLALLAARMVFAAKLERRLNRRWLRALLYTFALGVGLFLLATFGAAAWAIGRSGDRANAVGLLGFGALFAAIFVPYCIKRVMKREYVPLQLASILAFIIGTTTAAWAAGHWPDMRISTRLAAAMKAADPSGTRPIASAAFHEDSLIFETHGRSRRVDEWKLREWLEANHRALVVLDRDRAPYWPRFAVIAEVSGLNYSNGKRVDLVVGEFLEANDPK